MLTDVVWAGGLERNKSIIIILFDPDYRHCVPLFLLQHNK